MSFDLVIRNGSLILFDPPRLTENGAIGIADGTIQTITGDSHIKGKKEIDATGKIIAPGFIDFHSHVDGKIFSAAHVMRQGATTTIGGGRNFDGKAIRKISENGFLINHGFFISHSFTLRRAIGIRRPEQVATETEIREMCILAERFLESGSFGIHFGLEFVPGTTTKEIIALARLARRYRRVVVVHLRKDGSQALESLEEVLHVAEVTGVSVHILHLMYMVGFHGVMEQALEMIDAARARGLDITADTGLYAAFPSCIGSSILDDDWASYYGQDVTEKNLMISSGIYAGQLCTEEMFQYLREEFPSTLVTVFVCDQAEAERALKKPYVFVSTNAADGPHYENMGHPETSGTFPRLIRKYVYDKKLLPLPEAIRKITADPARRFGIEKKGEIRIGHDADLVLFDPQTIRDRADYVGYGDPNAPPDGIFSVIVNGAEVLAEGEYSGIADAGRMLSARLQGK